jgi:hypothetical protein
MAALGAGPLRGVPLRKLVIGGASDGITLQVHDYQPVSWSIRRPERPIESVIC